MANGNPAGLFLELAQAEEVINLFAMAIRFDIPAAELGKMMYSYPTGGSNMAYML